MFDTNCTTPCICNANNTVYCDSTTGYCSCKSGWTGNDCSSDIDECSLKYTCPNYSQCHNLPGTYECRCKPGLSLNSNNYCSCNKNVTDQAGVITSPNFPQNYPNSVECNWLITVATDQIIDVRFTHLDLDRYSDQNCMDYIQFYDGPTQQYPMITNTIYCGYNNEEAILDISIRSSKNQILVVFKSDGISARAGFSTSYRALYCDPFTYGRELCNTSCTCNQTNTNYCNNFYGYCKCNANWTGENCSFLVEHCQDPNSCPDPYGLCVNIPGGYECRCKSGLTINSTGQCVECEQWYFGDNCGHYSKCDQTRTESYDKTNGLCHCYPNWTSTYCTKDFDECLNTTQQCILENDHASCFNTPGSFECRCLPGYEPVNETTCDECGKVLTNPSGRIISGSHLQNVSYTKYQECNWTIEAPAGQVVSLSFSSFNLNDAWWNYPPGYILIYDGNATSSSLIWNSYGNRYFPGPNIIRTTQNAMLIVRYSSWNGNTSPGFTASYWMHECPSNMYDANCTTPCTCNNSNTAKCESVTGNCSCQSGWTGSDCNSDIDECSQKYFLCPDYSQCHNLPGTYKCQCKPGLTMESNNTCSFGFNASSCISRNCSHMCVSYMPENETSIIEECYCPVGKEWDGGQCVDCKNWTYGPDCEYETKCVKEHTASYDSMNGNCTCYSNWTSSQCESDYDECYNGNYTCQPNSYCSNTWGGYQCICYRQYGYFETSSNINQTSSNICEHKNCDLSFTNETGVILTDFYNYWIVNGYANCSWVISIRKDYVISLRFRNFYISSDFECQKHYMEIYDGESVLSRPIGRYCGSGIPSVIRSTGNNMLIKFISYDYYFYGYIYADYTSHACESFTYGKESCDKNCRCVKENTQLCDNIIGACTCKPGWTSRDCSTDVNECLGTNYNVCPPNSDCININGSYKCECHHRYKINSTTGECDGCGYNITDQAGVITSPNFPQNYPNNAECNWLITVATDQIIDVRFTHLDLDRYSDQNCLDYIQFYDGPTQQHPMIANTIYCGYSYEEAILDISIRSTKNQILVVFRSDSISSRAGFSASYRAHHCDPFTYGRELCNTSCICNQTNTDYCDNFYGFCMCNANWTGENCSVLVEHCKDPNTCPDPYGICVNVPGGYECKCKSGLKMNSTGHCVESLRLGLQITGFKPPGTQVTHILCGANMDIALLPLGFGDPETCSQTQCSHYCGVTSLDTLVETCYCPKGMMLNSSDNTQCVECVQWYFGDNCTYYTPCDQTRTESYDKTNGLCHCYPNWTSTYCTEDFDECLNTTQQCVLENDHASCFNTIGSFECRCLPGYEPVNETTCDECGKVLTDPSGRIFSGSHLRNVSYTKYQECNWTILAPAGQVVSLSFSSYNFFDLDIFIVDGNATSSRVIWNTYGNWYLSRPNIIRTTQNAMFIVQYSSRYGNTSPVFTASYWMHDCDPFTYGTYFCNTSCICNQTNTDYCDNIYGSCMCNANWTGENCSVLVEQCQDPNSCPDPFGICVNIPGGYECKCKSGLKMNSTGQCVDPKTCSQTQCSHYCGVTSFDPLVENCYCPKGMMLNSSDNTQCVECVQWYFGDNCTYHTFCDQTRTESYDKTNGLCHCYPNWTSSYCTEDFDECLNTRQKCVLENGHASCFNTPGSFECRCLPGYEPVNETTCDECGKVLTEPSGRIISGSHGQYLSYTVYQICNWTIEAQAGQVVSLSFSSFNLNDAWWNYPPGYILIYDGNATSSSLIWSSYGNRYLPGPNIIRTTQNAMLIVRYSAWYGNTSPGFTASYWMHESSCISRNCSHMCVSYMPENETSIIEECYCPVGKEWDGNRCVDCKNWTYGPDCEYETKCVKEHTASYNSIYGSCTCYSNWTSSQCESDYDECYNGNYTCQPNSYCSNTWGGYQCICYRQYGYFETSPNICELKNCDLSYTNETGVIMFDFYNYWFANRKANCSQVISVRKDYVISLRFHNFNIPSYFECQRHYMEIFDGESVFSRSIGRYCGSGIPNVIRSTGNNILIKFISYDYYFYGNFYANYTSHACESFTYGKESCDKNCRCVKENTQLCDNINGECTCKPGWTSRDCSTDVNECLGTNNNVCTPNSECININGSYKCECSHGYKINSTTGQCDTCFYNTSNTVSCDSTSGFCLCKTNWQGSTCNDDVNECSNNSLYNCSSNSYCNNTVGGYECLCQSDFYRNITMDKCKACFCNTSNTVSCDSTSGFCLCKTNWQGSTCNDDVNECSNNSLYNCSSNSYCNNTVGGYECPCQSDFYRNITMDKCELAITTSNTESCDSTSGFCLCKTNWQGSTCNDDVNECSNNSLYNCSSNSYCSNTVGGYECPCQSDFYRNITMDKCEACFCNTMLQKAVIQHLDFVCVKPTGRAHHAADDVNECSNNSLYNCSSNSYCNNTVGGYECPWAPCNDDVNECSNSSLYNCPSNSYCNNTVGGYECPCQSDFYRNITMDKCEACFCNTSNTESCDSTSGFCCVKPTGRAPSNDDVNECSNNSLYNCSSNSYCSNTVGGYECPCQSDFYRNITMDKCGACFCSTSNTENCDSTSGFCLCKTNWQGSTCNDDVNECSNNSLYNCSSNSYCNNTVGGYECPCQSDFYRNITMDKCEHASVTQVTQAVIQHLDFVCVKPFVGSTCNDDVNECSNNSLYNCSSNSYCNNTVGGYECPCQSDFYKKPPWTNASSLYNCSSNSYCNNTVGGYECPCQSDFYEKYHHGQMRACFCNTSNTESCDSTSGFCFIVKPTGRALCNDDVNEYSNSSLYEYSSNSYCNNTVGGYECPCQSDFYRNITMDKCESSTCNDDVNDVPTTVSINCSSNSYCNNTVGGYECPCQSDFYRNITMDKCEHASVAQVTQKAVIQHLDFVLCKTNWQGSTCNDDVNECSNNSLYNCSSNSYCNNTVGGYECPCQSDFYRNITMDKYEASSYGDPHIPPCDNKQYTLNGWAEYVMLSVPEKSFMLQARTHLAETSDGRITNATVFVAFAVSGDKDASRLQVELSEKKTGITMKIFVGLKDEITILAKNELKKKKPEDLWGNFDGDPNNEFLPDGSLLTANQTDTERKLFYNFGKKSTRDDEFAKNTNTTNKKTKAEVQALISLLVKGFYPGHPNLSSFSNTFRVQAEDDKGGSSNAITISTATCPNCHGHGDCDKSELCVENFNACTSNPCALRQNCTDLTPEQQGMNTTGYVPWTLSNGFEVKGTKCILMSVLTKTLKTCSVKTNINIIGTSMNVKAHLSTCAAIRLVVLIKNQDTCAHVHQVPSWTMMGVPVLIAGDTGLLIVQDPVLVQLELQGVIKSLDASVKLDILEFINEVDIDQCSNGEVICNLSTVFESTWS
ncbi:hypothetical protein Btru_063684 [Bulinus truncatus]|nr:hypothetical protein Btru_063684 [Bulinus truncatus]